MAATQLVIEKNALAPVRLSSRFGALTAMVAVVVTLGVIIMPLIPETIWNGLKAVIMGLAMIGIMWLSLLTTPLR